MENDEFIFRKNYLDPLDSELIRHFQLFYEEDSFRGIKKEEYMGAS